MSSPLGPKISWRAPTSNFSAAAMSASAACSGVSKVLVPPPVRTGADVAADCWAPERLGAPAITETTAVTVQKSPMKIPSVRYDFISTLRSFNSRDHGFICALRHHDLRHHDLRRHHHGCR